jgi:hypothetical protein
MGEDIWNVHHQLLLKPGTAITAGTMGFINIVLIHLANLLYTDSTSAPNLLRHIWRRSREAFPFTAPLFPLVTITRMFS